MINVPLSWHESRFVQLPARDALHHGLLVTGISGIGKREFAVALAQRILCHDGDPLECDGRCQSCQLFNAGSHPDMHVLCSEHEAIEGRLSLLGAYSNRYQDAVAREKKAKPSQIVPVDQMRLLIDRISQSAHISSCRVALIVPADRMNMNAANALLKLLEEPPENSFLLLVTDQPEVLPATVRSRCLVIDLAAPNEAKSLAWLGDQTATLPDTDTLRAMVRSSRIGPLSLLAHLEPTAAGQRQENNAALIQLLSGDDQVISLAARLAKQDIGEVLSWLQAVASDLVKWQATGKQPFWVGLDRTALNDRVYTLRTSSLFALYAKIGEYRRMARDQLNPQLALEDVLMGMCELSGARN